MKNFLTNSLAKLREIAARCVKRLKQLVRDELPEFLFYGACGSVVGNLVVATSMPWFIATPFVVWAVLVVIPMFEIAVKVALIVGGKWLAQEIRFRRAKDVSPRAEMSLCYI